MDTVLRRKLTRTAISLGALLGGLVCALLAWYCSFSFGWFSNNKEVNATGMTVGVETIPNLVIRETADDEWAFNITREEDITRMYAATEGGVGASGLKYVTNSDALSFHTGLAKNGNTLIYDEVEHDTLDEDEDGNPDHVYFCEYTFDVAMDTKETEGTLYVTLPELGSVNADETTEEFSDDNPLPDSHKACTVWVFVNDTDKGKITVADGDTPLEIFDGTVPSTDGPLSIKLRIYFDGELKKDDTTAYINSETVDLRGLLLNVRISLEEEEAA